MEKIVRIKSQGPLQQRNWTNPRTNESILISSVEFLLTDGIDTFVAEVTDQQALSLSKNPLDQQLVYSVQCRIDISEKKNDQTGEVRHFNKIRISKIQAV